MPTEQERLDWVHQRLDPQDHGMHEPDCVHRMEDEALNGADIA